MVIDAISGNAVAPTDAFLCSATAHRREIRIGARTRAQNAVEGLCGAVVSVELFPSLCGNPFPRSFFRREKDRDKKL